MSKKKTTGKKPEEAKKKEQQTSYDFDVSLFSSTQFIERTAEVPVPDLKAFFPAETKPAFLVKGLTSLELAKADQEVQINREANAERALQSLSNDVVNALSVLIRSHLGRDVPDAHVKTLQIVHMGLVKPKLEYDQVIKLAAAFPIEFRQTFMKINELTGRGMDFEKKPKGSGPNLESSTQ